MTFEEELRREKIRCRLFGCDLALVEEPGTGPDGPIRLLSAKGPCRRCGKSKPAVIRAKSLKEVFDHPDEEVIVDPQFKVRLVLVREPGPPCNHSPIVTGYDTAGIRVHCWLCGQSWTTPWTVNSTTTSACSIAGSVHWTDT